MAEAILHRDTLTHSHRRSQQHAFAAQQDVGLFAQPSSVSEDPALGFELGRDFAVHGLVPPPDYLSAGHPVRQGWEAGRQRHGRGSRPATPDISLCLRTRLQAWRQGQAFETLSLTPHLIGQLRVSHCPVTRTALHLPDGAPRGDQRGTPLHSVPPTAARRRSDQQQAGQAPATPASTPAVLSRLLPDAAWAAGHVTLLSPQAAAAIDPSADTRSALSRLDPAAQARLAVLQSFVTELPHAQAAALPLLVLPPNRLRLLNPIQALQAFFTRQLNQSGWSKRLPLLEDLLPGAGFRAAQVRSDLRQFVYTLVSRSIALGHPGRREADQRAWRHTLEDAWHHPHVRQTWLRLALQLTPQQAEAWLQAAADAGLATQGIRVLARAQAMDGWDLQPSGAMTIDGRTHSAPPRPAAVHVVNALVLPSGRRRSTSQAGPARHAVGATPPITAAQPACATPCGHVERQAVQGILPM